MGLLDDIADALGVSPRALRAEISTATAADAVMAIIFAKFWPHVGADKIAQVAGLDADTMRAALVRAHDRQRRTLIDETEERRAKKAGTPRKRHTPIGEPPSPEHRWCTRGDHWVHPDDMSRNSSRPSGYGDWCREHWREYWRQKVNERGKASRARSAARESPSPPSKRSGRAGTKDQA